jgi:hypothetical protein
MVARNNKSSPTDSCPPAKLELPNLGHFAPSATALSASEAVFVRYKGCMPWELFFGS